MENCININHPDVIKLSSELKLPPIVVAAKIGIWQEDNNNYEEFPTKEELISELTNVGVKDDDELPNISFEEIERVSNMIVNKLETLGNNFRKRDFTKAKHEIFYRNDEFIKYNTAKEIIENIFDSSTADKLDSRDTEKSLSDLLDSDLKGHFIEKLEKLKKAYPDEYEQSSVLETLQSDYRLIENFLKRNSLSEIDQYDETQQNTIKRVLNNLFDKSKNYNFKSEKQKIAFLGNKALQKLESKIKSQIEREKVSRFKLKSLIGKTETIINFLNIIPNYKELIKNKINNQIERVLFYKNKVISDKSTGIEKNILVKKLYDEASQSKKIDRLHKKAEIVNNDNILKYFPELLSNSEITLDLKTTLNRLIDNNSEYKDLALKLLSFSDSYSNLPIIITNNFKRVGGAAAYYSVDINNVVDKNTREHLGIIANSPYIEVDISSDNFKAEPDRTLLHEIIHSLTSIYLTSVDAKKVKNSPYKNLHAYIVKKLREFDASSNGILGFMNMPYGLKDEHELFAEALTNFEFQELLKQIPPIDEKKYRNVFEQIIDFIASIFSIDKYDSVYDQLEEVIYNTMNKQSSLNFTIEELLKSVNKDISDVEIMEDEQFKANQSTLSSGQIKDLQELKSKPEFKEGIEFVFNNNPKLQDAIYESLGLDETLSNITPIKDRNEAIKKYEEAISKEISGKPLINHLMLISSRNTGDIKNFADMIIKLSESNLSLKKLLDNPNLYAEHDSVGDQGRYVWNYKTRYSRNYISIEKGQFRQSFGNYDDVFLHELIHNLTTAAVIKESDQYNETFTKKIETLFDEFVSKQANKKIVDSDFVDKVSNIISKLKDLLLFTQNANSLDIYNKFKTDDDYVKIKIDDITIINGKVTDADKNNIKISKITDKINTLIKQYESILDKANEGDTRFYYFLTFENKQDQMSEFLTTFMTDESFRNELKLIPYKNSTFYDKIIEFIGNLLGLTKDDTLYNEFTLTLSDFISNNDYSELAKQTPKVALENELNDIKAQKQQALDTYADYIAKISLGIIKNPTTGKYNDSKVKDIVYHGGLKGIKEYLKEYIGKNEKSFTKAIYFSSKYDEANKYRFYKGNALDSPVPVLNYKIGDQYYFFPMFKVPHDIEYDGEQYSLTTQGLRRKYEIKRVISSAQSKALNNKFGSKDIYYEPSDFDIETSYDDYVNAVKKSYSETKDETTKELLDYITSNEFIALKDSGLTTRYIYDDNIPIDLQKKIVKLYGAIATKEEYLSTEDMTMTYSNLIDVKNPFIVYDNSTYLGDKTLIKELKDIGYDISDIKENQDFYSYLIDSKKYDDFTDFLKQKGYDSFIIQRNDNIEYQVFEPEQIHILGSKSDIDGIKEFIKNNSENEKLTTNNKSSLSVNLNNQNQIPYIEDTTLKYRLFNGKETSNAFSVLENISFQDSPLSFLAKELLNNSKAKDLKDITIKLISKNDDIYKELSEIVSKKKYDTDYKFKSFAGMILYNENMIYIVKERFDYKYETAIIHEILHALTHEKINTNVLYRNEWNDIYNYVYQTLIKNNINPNDWYAMVNPDELLTGIFTDARFMKMLSTIKSNDISLYNYIIEFFKKLLNINNVSLLDEVMTQGLNMLNDLPINEKYYSDNTKSFKQSYADFNEMVETAKPNLILTEQVLNAIPNDPVIKYIDGSVDDYIDLYNSQEYKPTEYPYIRYNYVIDDIKKYTPNPINIDKRVYKSTEFNKLLNKVESINKEQGYNAFKIIERIDGNYLVTDNQNSNEVEDIKKDLLKSLYKKDEYGLNVPWYYYAKEIINKDVIFKHKDIYFSLDKNAFIYMMQNNIEPEYTLQIKENFADTLKIPNTNFNLLSDIVKTDNNMYLKIKNNEPVYIPNYNGLSIIKDVPMLFYKKGNNVNINKEGKPVLIDTKDIEIDKNGIVITDKLPIIELDINANDTITKENNKTYKDYYVDNIFKNFNISNYLTTEEAEELRNKILLKLKRDNQKYDIEFVKNKEYNKIVMTMNDDNVINVSLNFNPITVKELENMDIIIYDLKPEYLKSLYELTTNELNNDLTCSI